MLLTTMFLPTLALSVLAAPIINSSAKIDEVRPEQAAVVGDQGRAAQDSYAPDPDIWVVEKRAAQNSVAPDPDIWVVERSTSESPQPQKLDA